MSPSTRRLVRGILGLVLMVQFARVSLSQVRGASSSPNSPPPSIAANAKGGTVLTFTDGVSKPCSGVSGMSATFARSFQEVLDILDQNPSAAGGRLYWSESTALEFYPLSDDERAQLSERRSNRFVSLTDKLSSIRKVRLTRTNGKIEEIWLILGASGPWTNDECRGPQGESYSITSFAVSAVRSSASPDRKSVV